MNQKTTVVLGGGFGGVAVATELRKRLPADNPVLLVDRRRTFSMGLSNLWVMNGVRKHPGEGERPLSRLEQKGVRYVGEEITKIDPGARKIWTPSRVLEADYMVIALGAELAPQAVPGFAQSAFDLYDPQGALGLHGALETFTSGKIVIVVARTPFKCPAAPYEAAFLIDAFFRDKGLRNHIEIALYTPEDRPMPVAGRDISNALQGMLRERDITYFTEHAVMKIDGESKRVLFEIDDAPFELLVGVPPHIAPSVVRAAGLVDSTGWIPVHSDTLETRFPNVFAIGDITTIKLKNGRFLPKAGVFAEREAQVVAENIAASITGAEAQARFNGDGNCFVEVGNGLAAFGEGSFFASPAPRVTLKPPSVQLRQQKEDFERVRLQTWFS